MERSKVEHTIEKSEFFRGLDRTYLLKIASLCQIQTYEPGESVFSQGDYGEHLYIIADGHISLERSVDLGARKGTAVIGVLGKGRILGCWSTLLGEPHNLMSSAICQKPTEVVAVKGSDLREMMTSNSELGFVLLERLCFLLRDRIEGAFGAMEKLL
ncbi:MAG: cyclic nucleotide-binding domain-containing protein [Deltaproteobacteria bacterium]|uniref:Cyclic nucleotide-binding domain-containing protein n=1 Tax=Candidatus Desulfacyla euxinica TaxID=2841693 RepID=A0A8J6MYX8_9DELT|nr:cyclic nucleotide-binding domain-containing protein [Candidatus Desulfacyla euxinica]MBL7217649.1 cyclic nucleotide-binding domain-containing protein [Desulfobacteraceae bacterium]